LGSSAPVRASSAGLIGVAIRQMRAERGLSKRELSLRAGLSESYVGKLESGRIDPSMRAFGKIAVALKLTRAEVHFLVLEAARAADVVTPDQ